MSESLRLQDDILQMMYWMRGEHLGERVVDSQLNRFLNVDETLLSEALQKLIDRGMVERVEGEEVQLTALGIEEGKHRFLDEFSSYLGKDSHLSCSDPECDCGDSQAACRSLDSLTN